jgi:hypothetical protein
MTGKITETTPVAGQGVKTGMMGYVGTRSDAVGVWWEVGSTVVRTAFGSGVWMSAYALFMRSAVWEPHTRHSLTR